MLRPLLSLVLAIAFSATAHAAPAYSSTASAAKNLRKSQLKLAKSVAALSTTDREKLKVTLKSVGTDSDNDGVSDIFEAASGSNLCSSDSDGDGTPDANDDYEDDGNRSGDSKAQGTITSFNDPLLEVAGQTFTITDTTEFKGKLSSKTDLVVGTCVKVEGYTDASNTNFAKQVEGSNHCSGGNGGGGNGNED